MSDLASERLAELRRIAEAATPGPWGTTRYNGGLRFDGPLRVYAGTDPEYGEPRPIPATDADTRYIAAFDPPTVLALLDEIERLHGQLRLATVDQAIVEAEANDARAEVLKERIYALEADLDTAQHADHEETIRALVVAADRLAALEAELASMRTDRYESRATTHADVCWSWGPKHYECAVGQIRRDETLLRQVLEVLSRTHQTAMEQAMKARVPECAEFAEIFQDLDYVVAALRERLGEGDQP